MAEYDYNNGTAVDLTIDPKFASTKLYVSVSVKPDDASVKIGGHTVISCYPIANIVDVIFNDQPLDYASALNGKMLTIIVDASKFKVVSKELQRADLKVTTSVVIEAGDVLLQTYTMNDGDTPENNSVFNFYINLKLSA